MVQKISEINDKNIGVISLQLSNLDGTMQNPYGAINKPIKTYWKIGLMHMLMIVKVWDILKWIKRKFKKPKSELQHINYENFDYVISGAAFILTPNFFEHYDQLFNKTFLYCEENILAMYLKKAKLKSVFLTNSQIKQKG